MTKEIKEFDNSLDSKIERRLNQIEKKLDSISTSKSLLSRKETASLLSVNLSTLYNWNKQGVLKPFQIGGRVFYRYKDIEESLTLLNQLSNEKR